MTGDGARTGEADMGTVVAEVGVGVLTRSSCEKGLKKGCGEVGTGDLRTANAMFASGSIKSAVTVVACSRGVDDLGSGMISLRPTLYTVGITVSESFIFNIGCNAG